MPAKSIIRTLLTEALTLGTGTISCVIQQCDVGLFHCWPSSHGSLISAIFCLAFELRLHNLCDSNSLFNYVSKVLSTKLSIKHQVLVLISINFTDIKPGHCLNTTEI